MTCHDGGFGTDGCSPRPRPRLSVSLGFGALGVLGLSALALPVSPNAGLAGIAITAGVMLGAALRLDRRTQQWDAAQAAEARRLLEARDASRAMLAAEVAKRHAYFAPSLAAEMGFTAPSTELLEALSAETLSDEVAEVADLEALFAAPAFADGGAA